MDETPQDLGESMNDFVEALKTSVPEIGKLLRNEYGKQAQAEFDVSADFSPKILKLMKDMTGSTDYADMAETGRKMSDAEQKAAAETEFGIASGSGTKLAKLGKELQDMVDPEAAKNRTNLMDHLKTLFTSVDPNKLTEGESEEISRDLGRTAWNVGSPIQAAKDAMTFGSKLADRRKEYADYIDLENSVQPQLRSGLSGIGMATQRTMMPNSITPMFTGIQTPGVANSNAIGSSMIAPATNFQMARMSKQKGVIDQIAKVQDTSMAPVTNILGSVGGGGGVASIAGAFCWVAREVYGEDNPKWIQFRYWVLHKAPIWLHDLYRNHGEQFAQYISDKPLLKALVRQVMNFILWRAN